MSVRVSLSTFNSVVPCLEYGSVSTKLLNSDAIWIQILSIVLSSIRWIRIPEKVVVRSVILAYALVGIVSPKGYGNAVNRTI